jgi:hypothetical protein
LSLRTAAAGLEARKVMKRDRMSSDLLASIDALIEALSTPLSRADKRAGWDERLQKSWHKHFIDLRERIAHGEWPNMPFPM